MDIRLAGNKRVEDSLRRLQTMVKNQYGRDLEISSIVDVSSSADSRVKFRGEDLFIPVEINGERLGTAIVKKAAGLDSSSTHRLSDLVRLILEPVLSGFKRDIDFQNDQEVVQPDIQNENSLLLDLNDLHPKIINNSEVRLKVEPKVSKSIAYTFESYNPNKAFQAAIDVHEFIESWAFMTWTDLRPRLRTMDELVKLGRCTLFINDVLEITPEERDLLVRFFAIQTPEMPAIVIGTRRSLKVLLSEGMIDDGLVSAINKSSINLDLLPSSKGAVRECIELLVNGELQ